MDSFPLPTDMRRGGVGTMMAPLGSPFPIHQTQVRTTHQTLAEQIDTVEDVHILRVVREQLVDGHVAGSGREPVAQIVEAVQLVVDT